MKKSGGSLLVVCCAVLLARPGLAAADVVPARKSKPRNDAARVESRLASLGVPAKEASDCVGSLTASELDFFAGDPGRVQSVGGLTFAEWLGGGAVLILMTTIYFAFISNHD